mgnify:CR=1 FL=1
MSDLDHERNSPRHFLNRLSTETLKQILQDDFESEDSDSPENDEFITCVMEVIAQREIETSECSKFDVDAGWRDFRRYYQPEEEAAAPVCGGTAPAGLIESKGQDKETDLNSRRPGRAAHHILRAAAIAVTVASLCIVAAGAIEVNIFEMVAEWTQDVFQFRSETSTSQDAVYETGVFLEDDQTLKGLLEEAGITQPVYPKWIPEGYTFFESKVFVNNNNPLFIVKYESESSEKPITVSVIAHRGPEGILMEKNEGDIASYVKNGIEHCIMNNSDVLVATWFTGTLECFIGGEVSETEMKIMIDSIYEE